MSVQVKFEAKGLCTNLQENYKDDKEHPVRAFHVLRANGYGPLIKNFGILDHTKKHKTVAKPLRRY